MSRRPAALAPLAWVEPHLPRKSDRFGGERTRPSQPVTSSVDVERHSETPRRTSQLGGERPYGGNLGKDRSARQSRLPLQARNRVDRLLRQSPLARRVGRVQVSVPTRMVASVCSIQNSGSFVCASRLGARPHRRLRRRALHLLGCNLPGCAVLPFVVKDPIRDAD